MSQQQNLKLQKILLRLDYEALQKTVGWNIHRTYCGVVDLEEAIGWAGVGMAMATKKFDVERTTAESFSEKDVRSFLRRKGYLMAIDEMRKAKVVDRTIKGVVKKTTLSTRNLSGVRVGFEDGNDGEYQPQDLSTPPPDTMLVCQDFFEWTKSILKPWEWDVIHFYYECRLTMYHIGIIMNTSEARVSQVHTRILSKIRAAVDKNQN